MRRAATGGRPYKFHIRPATPSIGRLLSRRGTPLWVPFHPQARKAEPTTFAVVLQEKNIYIFDAIKTSHLSGCNILPKRSDRKASHFF